MADYKLTLRDARRYVAAVSGLFYSPKTQQSFSNREMSIIALLMLDARKGHIVVSADAKKEIADIMGTDLKSIQNAITRLKRKNVINGTGQLHSIFRNPGRYIVEWVEPES